MSIVHHSVCPVCGGKEIDPLLTVKDSSVSGEAFVVWQCALCQLRFTQDAPDEASIGAYYQSPDYISHTNTSTGLINKLYQKVRKITLKQKGDLIIRHTGTSRGSLLDVGAGTGAFLAAMQDRGWQVAGVEPDEDARKRAKKIHALDLNEPALLDSLPGESFDVITLWHVLEHIHPLHPYLETLKRLLKKEGRIFIAVPNYQSLDSAVYKLYWAAYDVPRHLYHFAPSSMEALVQQHRLKLTAKKRMWFDAFYISLLSSKYKNGSSNWLGAGMAALRSNAAAVMDKDKCSSLIYVVQKA